MTQAAEDKRTWRDITLESLKVASEFVWNSPLVYRTPMMSRAEGCLKGLGLPDNLQLYLKLESSQNTRCYKIRGATFQFHRQIERRGGTKEGLKMVCYSGGNYGKAFATVAQEMGIEATVIMPTHVPQNRVAVLEGLGAKVEQHPQDELMNVVADKVNNKGLIPLHPFDDLDLIAGHSTCGFEIMEVVPEPDIVLSAIGGGGLLSGVSSAIRLSGNRTAKIYGVEPETSNVMYRSFQLGEPTILKGAHSVAVGTCAPNAGIHTYEFLKEFINDVLLVNDEDILFALRVAFSRFRLVLEPTGAVALAALLAGKVPGIPLNQSTKSSDHNGPIKVVVVMSGSNVSWEEFESYEPALLDKK